MAKHEQPDDSASVFDEIQGAASDASASAKKAAEVTRRALSRGIHRTAYVSTYGIVFASVFLVELLPSVPPRRVEAEDEVRLLENKKRGPVLKFGQNNRPGSQSSGYEHEITVRKSQGTRSRRVIA